MRINIETLELQRSMIIIDKFNKMSSFYTQEFKNYVRFLSQGDGVLYLIVNNTGDTKIILNIGVEEGIKIDKIYIIGELYNVIKNMINYSVITLEDNIIYFPDGKFSLMPIELSQTRRDLIFGLNDASLEYSERFIINDDTESEIKDIFKLLDLRSNSSTESYFFKDDYIYFNFRNIYVKKKSDLKFLVTDLFSLRMISIILLKNKYKEVFYEILEGKIYLKSDDFYFETRIFEEKQNTVDFVGKYFNFKKEKILEKGEDGIVEELNINVEFFNFIEAVVSYDNESVVVFSDEKKVFIQSRYQDFVANFNIKKYDGNTFVISTENLHKILKYIMNEIKPENLKFKTINVNKSTFIFFDCEDKKLEIISEIM